VLKKVEKIAEENSQKKSIAALDESSSMIGRGGEPSGRWTSSDNSKKDT